MGITRQFSVFTELSVIPEITNSLGSHLAAKLESFASDERTLTDEFCDMICIWATITGHLPSRHRIRTSLPPVPIQLLINKVSSQEEITIGADLEFIVRSPLGAKRLLAQAKVLDPSSHRLRCDHSAGWAKLRDQLAKCRSDAGDLSFLLAYVPEGELNGARYSFSTWEQSYVKAGSGADSRFGATFIPVDELLDASGQWLTTPPISYVGGGQFLPRGLSFTKLLLELLSCVRGTWRKDLPMAEVIADTVNQIVLEGYRTLDVTIGEIGTAGWNELTPLLRRALEDYDE
jgi:hypothetical protein